MEEFILSRQKVNAFMRGLSAHCAIIVSNGDGIITRVNQKFCDASGYKEEELIGRHLNLMKSGYHPAAYFRQMWKTLKSGNGWQGEIVNRAKDGSFFLTDTIVIPVTNEEGTEEYISIGHVRNRSNELTLPSDEQRYRRIVDQLPGMVILSDADGNCTYVNEKYASFFEKAPADLIGKPQLSWLPVGDRKAYLARLKTITPSNPTIKSTFKFKDKQGKRKHILWSETGIFDEEGELVEILSMGRNVTNLDENAQEDIQPNDELMLVDLINRASIEGASFTDIMNMVLEGFRMLTDSNSSRLYEFNAAENSLYLLSEIAEEEIVKVLRRRFGYESNGKLHRLHEKPLLNGIVHSRELYMANKPRELSKLSYEITDSRIIRLLSVIGSSLRKHKPILVIPLMAQDELFGTVILSPEKKMTDSRLQSVTRFAKQIAAALAKARAEEEIEKQKKFTETVLNNIPADIAVFDERHRYLFVNPMSVASEEMRKWLIGKDDFEYANHKGIDSGFAERRRKLFIDAAVENKYVEWIDEYEKDGVKKYHFRKFYPYREDGRLKYIFGYGMDITNLKKAEKEKNEYIKKLEEMAYFNSHKVRLPVTQIMGLANTLEGDSLSQEELQKIAGYMRNAAEKLDEMTRELALDLDVYRSRLEREKMEQQD